MTSQQWPVPMGREKVRAARSASTVTTTTADVMLSHTHTLTESHNNLQMYFYYLLFTVEETEAWGCLTQSPCHHHDTSFRMRH